MASSQPPPTSSSSSPSSPKMKIYLAGPEVFLPDPLAAGSALKALCAKHGAEGLFPMDNVIPEHVLVASKAAAAAAAKAKAGGSIPQVSGSGREAEADGGEVGEVEEPTSIATWIRTQNMTMLHTCDGVIANMTPFRSVSMDVGTAYEMGVASALGKIVIAYSSDSRTYVSKVIQKHGAKRDERGVLRDEDGMSVEEFEGEELLDNLMMSAGGCHNPGGVVCSSAEEAVVVAVGIWEGRRKSKEE